MMDPQEIAGFRLEVAKYPGFPLPDICNLREDPDESAQKTYLMQIACELLLRMQTLEICKMIVAAKVLGTCPTSGSTSLCEAISFVEAEDRGELIVSIKEPLRSQAKRLRFSLNCRRPFGSEGIHRLCDPCGSGASAVDNADIQLEYGGRC
jgi:hypothetical protein